MYLQDLGGPRTIYRHRFYTVETSVVSKYISTILAPPVHTKKLKSPPKKIQKSEKQLKGPQKNSKANKKCAEINKDTQTIYQKV